MPCPLFLPRAPSGEFLSEPFPLGDLYNGTCAADTTAPIPNDTLRRCCNLGYARGVCDRASQSDSDAARFLIRSDTSGRIEIAWSLERDHHPVAVGSLTLEKDAIPPDTPLNVQANAFMQSYLRQTGGTT